MLTVLVVILLVLAVVVGLVSIAPPYTRFIGLAIAFVAAALLVSLLEAHVGLH